MSDEDLKKVKLVEIKPHVKINFGRLSVFPISVTHSIPDSLLYVLYTKRWSDCLYGGLCF